MVRRASSPITSPFWRMGPPLGPPFSCHRVSSCEPCEQHRHYVAQVSGCKSHYTQYYSGAVSSTGIMLQITLHTFVNHVSSTGPYVAQVSCCKSRYTHLWRCEQHRFFVANHTTHICGAVSSTGIMLQITLHTFVALWAAQVFCCKSHYTHLWRCEQHRHHVANHTTHICEPCEQHRHYVANQITHICEPCEQHRHYVAQVSCCKSRYIRYYSGAVSSTGIMLQIKLHTFVNHVSSTGIMLQTTLHTFVALWAAQVSCCKSNYTHLWTMWAAQALCCKLHYTHLWRCEQHRHYVANHTTHRITVALWAADASCCKSHNIQDFSGVKSSTGVMLHIRLCREQWYSEQLRHPIAHHILQSELLLWAAQAICCKSHYIQYYSGAVSSTGTTTHTTQGEGVECMGPSMGPPFCAKGGLLLIGDGHESVTSTHQISCVWMNTHTHTHWCTQTLTHRCAHTHTHPYTPICTHTLPHWSTHTHIHWCKHTYTHQHVNAYTHRHKRGCTLTCKQARTHTDTHLHTHRHTYTHACTHAHTHARMHTHT